MKKASADGANTRVAFVTALRTVKTQSVRIVIAAKQTMMARQTMQQQSTMRELEKWLGGFRRVFMVVRGFCPLWFGKMTNQSSSIVIATK
jgi:hypothetical protein